MATNNHPNEYGYAGGASTPEPGQAHPDAAAGPDAEREAVPAGDLTGALSDGLDDAVHPDDPSDHPGH